MLLDLLGSPVPTNGIPARTRVTHPIQPRKETTVPKKFPPPSPPYLPADWHGGRQQPTLGVIHSAVMPCKPGMAKAMVNAFRGSRPASAHYGVDPEEDYQYVLDHTVAYHCGHNDDSIAFEMCDMPGPIPGDKPGTARWKALRASWRWIRPEQQQMLDHTARLAAEVALAYGWRPVWLGRRGLRAWEASGHALDHSGFTTHALMSAEFKQSVHWDPGWWPRRKFMRLVRRHMAELRAEAKAGR